MTHFLRFPDADAWTAAASEAGFMADDTLLAYTHDRAIDVVGTISRGGEYDLETGAVIVAPVILDGWHVNFIGELPEGWEQYLVEPRHPARVFAAALAPELTRARRANGTFISDDPATPDVDEAWVPA